MRLLKWTSTVAVFVTLASAGSGRSQTTPPAAAKALSRVTKLDIMSRRLAFGGKSFGTAGPYEILIGRAHAVADPRAAQNVLIVDIDKAPRNAVGLVDYSFDVQILK